MFILQWVYEKVSVKFTVKFTMSSVDGYIIYMHIGCHNCSEYSMSDIVSQDYTSSYIKLCYGFVSGSAIILAHLVVLETVSLYHHIPVTTAIFCLQKPITTFLTELHFVVEDDKDDEADLLLKMIPKSVLCQNYVDLRLQLRRYI